MSISLKKNVSWKLCAMVKENNYLEFIMIFGSVYKMKSNINNLEDVLFFLVLKFYGYYENKKEVFKI